MSRSTRCRTAERLAIWLSALLLLAVSVANPRPASAVDPRGNAIATSTYYPDGRLQAVTDAAGNTTRYAYDVPAHLTTVTNPDGGVDARQTDTYGMLISETDPLSRTTTFSYDSKHNLRTRTDAAGTECSALIMPGSTNRLFIILLEEAHTRVPRLTRTR